MGGVSNRSMRTIAGGKAPECRSGSSDMLYVGGEVTLALRGLKLRPEPVLDFSVEKVFRVRDFGVSAGDGKTWTAGVQLAIDEAIRSGVLSRIEFEKGVYRLDVP